MMFRKVGLPIALALATSCAPGSPENPDATIMSTGTETIAQSVEQIAVNAIEEFKLLYGCMEIIGVEIREIDIESPLEKNQDGITGGTATRGLVIISPIVEDIEKNIPGAIRHTALHEADHACNIGDVMFSDPYDLKETGIKMIGSNGLSAIGINNATNERLTFSLIEEGVADLIAYTETNINSAAKGHRAVRETTSKILEENNITLQEVQDFQEKSDLIGFIARIVDKNPAKVTADDISIIFNIYIKDAELIAN